MLQTIQTCHPRISSLNCEEWCTLHSLQGSIICCKLSHGKPVHQVICLLANKHPQYYSILAFISSVCPSVCGSKGVDTFCFISRRQYWFPHNVEAICGALTDTIVAGSSWTQTTFQIHSFANPGAFIMIRQGTKCCSFERWSTAAQTAFNTSVLGNLTKISYEISSRCIHVLGGVEELPTSNVVNSATSRNCGNSL